MKVLTIPDLHGRNNWKFWSDKLEYVDKAVFLGNYVDGPQNEVPDNVVIQNLMEIIELKNQFPEKIVLLFGNHDLQYYFKDTEYQSRVKNLLYRESYAEQLKNIFTQNESIFTVSFQDKNFLWTHGGFGNMATRFFFGAILKTVDVDKYSYVINEMFARKHSDIFSVSGMKKMPKTAERGFIFGADYQEVSTDLVLKLHQIVGHNPVKKISTKFNTEIKSNLQNRQISEEEIMSAIGRMSAGQMIRDEETIQEFIDYDTSATFTNCLTYKNSFLIVDTDNIQLNKIIDL